MANQTVTVLEADGTTQTDVEVLGFGRQAAAASKSVGLATEDKAQLDAAVTALQLIDNAISGSEMQVDIVSGTVTANLSATDNAVLDAIAASLALIDNAIPSGNELQVDVVTLPAVDMTDDYTRQVGRVKVVNDAGTVIDPVAQVAHDAADSGEPVKIGAKAVTGISTQTAVADDDRTNLFAGIDGVLITRPYCGLEDIARGTATMTASTSNVECIAAVASTRHYITTIIVTNTSATASEAYIKDGTTTVMTVSAPANGGAIINLPVPLRGSSNTAWNAAAADSVTSLICDMVGFKSLV